MEEDVEPGDEDGVDGRGVSGWDGWMCGLGSVVVSSIFGLVRWARTFAPDSGLGFGFKNAARATTRGFDHFLSAASSSRLEPMVGGVLARASAFLKEKIFPSPLAFSLSF